MCTKAWRKPPGFFWDLASLSEVWTHYGILVSRFLLDPGHDQTGELQMPIFDAAQSRDFRKVSFQISSLTLPTCSALKNKTHA
jgi:hypothetical protein